MFISVIGSLLSISTYLISPFCKAILVSKFNPFVMARLHQVSEEEKLKFGMTYLDQ